MTSPELDNLVRIGKLKREPASDEEVVGLLQSAADRLNDAGRADLSYSSLLLQSRQSRSAAFADALFGSVGTGRSPSRTNFEPFACRNLHEFSKSLQS